MSLHVDSFPPRDQAAVMQGEDLATKVIANPKSYSSDALLLAIALNAVFEKVGGLDYEPQLDTSPTTTNPVLEDWHPDLQHGEQDYPSSGKEIRSGSPHAKG